MEMGTYAVSFHWGGAADFGVESALLVCYCVDIGRCGRVYWFGHGGGCAGSNT